MSLGISGVYQMRLKIGDIDVPITPNNVTRFEITEYLDRFLPTIYINFRDTSGFLTHLTHFDSRYNTLTVSFSNDSNIDAQKDIKFKVFRRKPESIVQMSNDVSINGVLDVKNIFSPNYERGWELKSIEEIINEISAEIGFTTTQINVGLTQPVSIVQPNWTNSQFLNYLCDNVACTNGDFAFFAFVDIPGFLKTRLNFMSLTNLLKQKSVQTFINLSEVKNSDDMPIYSYNIIDSYDLVAHLGIEKQTYGYFDYLTGEYITRTIDLEDADFVSLSNYYAYDSNDSIGGLSQNLIGTTNRFSLDYEPVARGNYYKKINSLVKIWIHSSGTNKINPGNIVKIIFPETSQGESISSYQYSGYWLVEQIKHTFGSTYITSLLLTRPGFDTDQTTTFVKAKKIKK